MIATLAAFLAATATAAALLLVPRLSEIPPEPAVRIAQLLVYAIYGAMGRAVGYRLPLIGLGAAAGIALAARQDHVFRHLDDSPSMVVVHGLQAMGLYSVALLAVPAAAALLVEWRHQDLSPGSRLRGVIATLLVTCPWFWTWYFLLTSPAPLFPGLEGWSFVLVMAAELGIVAVAGGLLTGAAGVGAVQTSTAVGIAVAWGGCAAVSQTRGMGWNFPLGGCVAQGLDLGIHPWLFWMAAMSGWYIARRRIDSRSPGLVSGATRTVATRSDRDATP